MKNRIGLAVITLLLSVSSLPAATLFVSLESTNPTAPYATWDTAATNIQQAVGAATAGDRVLVTNGVYAGYVGVTNPLTLLSVNGPQFTAVDGGGTSGCAYLTHGASLSGFTLTNGRAFGGSGVSCASTDAFLTNCVIAGNSTICVFIADGGGASGGTLYNCIISGNSCACSSQGGLGGGAFDSILYNCVLSGNSAKYGGGASFCTLYNCTLAGNSAIYFGGGVYDCTLYNCVVYSNTAPSGTNYANSSGYTLNYCCTTPLPPDGVANITNAPLFVDYTAGNLRLQSNSPCINAGNNAYVSYATDLDGNARIVSGTVDIGAYEFQGAGSMISYAWLQEYGLPTDGSVDYADPDGDQLNNWQEWICGTDPTDSASVLKMLTPSNGPTGITVPWQSVNDRAYSLEQSTNLNFSFKLLATNIPGQAGTTTYTDTNAYGPGPFFYRVGVQH